MSLRPVMAALRIRQAHSQQERKEVLLCFFEHGDFCRPDPCIFLYRLKFFRRKADRAVGFEGESLCKKAGVHPVCLDFLARCPCYCRWGDNDAGEAFFLKFSAKSVSCGTCLVSNKKNCILSLRPNPRFCKPGGTTYCLTNSLLC